VEAVDAPSDAALADVAGLAPAEVETDFDPLLEQPALRTNRDLVGMFSLQVCGVRTPFLTVVRVGGPETLRITSARCTADATTLK
jgi:hypothetical protein